MFVPNTSTEEVATSTLDAAVGPGTEARPARPWPESLLNRFGHALALFAAFCCVSYTLMMVCALFDAEVAFVDAYGEYLDLFALGVCGAAFAAGVAARAAGRLAWLDGPRLVYWQQAALRYILAYIVISYGVAKIFGEQFYSLQSTLDTPLRDVSGLQLAWRFFGYSYAYTLFLAAAQIGGSLLLLLRRTVTLGALSLLPVFTNIVFINFTHEIPVKLFSAVLLLIILYLLLLDHARLRALLLAGGAVGQAGHAAPPFGRTRAHDAAKALVVLSIFAFNFGTSYYFYLDINRERPLQGVWEVVDFQLNGSPRTSRDDPETWEKVYFEQGGIAAIKTAAPRASWFGFEVDEGRRTITLENYKTGDKTTYSYELGSADVLIINTEGGSDRLRVSLRKRAG